MQAGPVSSGLSRFLTFQIPQLSEPFSQQGSDYPAERGFVFRFRVFSDGVPYVMCHVDVDPEHSRSLPWTIEWRSAPRSSFNRVQCSRILSWPDSRKGLIDWIKQLGPLVRSRESFVYGRKSLPQFSIFQDSTSGIAKSCQYGAADSENLRWSRARAEMYRIIPSGSSGWL
jgi:hypothetical protein